MISLTITDQAATILHNLLEKQTSSSNGDSLFFTIGLTQGGCAGMEYQLSITSEVKNSFRIKSEGTQNLPILVLKENASLLDGLTIDFDPEEVEALDPLSGLKMINPNATKTCGCGNSFSTE